MSTILESAGRLVYLGGIRPGWRLGQGSYIHCSLGSHKLQLAVLHDRGSSPAQNLESLIHQKLIEGKRVLDFSIFRTPADQETDIEDLFPEGVYLGAFNKAYAKELKGASVAVSDLGQHPRIVERLNHWLKKNGISLLKDGGFNHYRVAQALLPMLTEASLSSADLDRFEKLFDRLNRLLS